MTRFSSHAVSAAILSTDTAVIHPTEGRVRLSESRYPYGQADVTIPIPTVPVYSDWVEQRRNIFPDPGVTATTFFIQANGQNTLSYVNGAARFTLAIAGAIGINLDGTMVKPGTEYRLLLRARANRPLRACERIRLTKGPQIEIGTDYAWYDLTAVAGNGSISQTGFILENGWGHQAGDWIEIDRVLIAYAPDSGDWYDGDTIPNGELVRTRWVGPVNKPESVVEAREATGWSPYDYALELMNPRRGDVRLILDLRESVGDPVEVSEVTADHAGSMAALTTAFTGEVAAVTAAYFTPWDTGTRPGTSARLNLVVTAREVNHAEGTVKLTAFTDEALAVMYRLISNLPESSGSTSVRDTVNYALGKIGAALMPGTTDATITEAEAIVWEPGVSAWDYMRGVAEAAGLVVRCDTRRRWTLTERDATLPDSVALHRSANVIESVDVDTQQYADAVVVRYDWRDPATGEPRTRYDTASMRSDAVAVKLIERSTPFPGRGAAAYWLARLAARGRVFDITQVNDYSILPSMGFSAAVPGAPSQVGRIESVEWVLDDPVMTITTAGAADAVPGAIDLFPADIMIADLTGMIDDLNPGSEEAA